MNKKHKLYCYVDETGQDTKGALFLVALVVTSEERNELMRETEHIESATGKNITKWHKLEHKRRVEYLKEIFSSASFKDKLFFASYKRAGDAYLDLLVLSVARAINYKAKDSAYKTTVVVDGLNKTEIRRFTHGLRSLHVLVRSVRGGRDESDALLRLADALAGFLRDITEKAPYALELQRVLHTNKKIIELV